MGISSGEFPGGESLGEVRLYSFCLWGEKEGLRGMGEWPNGERDMNVELVEFCEREKNGKIIRRGEGRERRVFLD